MLSTNLVVFFYFSAGVSSIVLSRLLFMVGHVTQWQVSCHMQYYMYIYSYMYIHVYNYTLYIHE